MIPLGRIYSFGTLNLKVYFYIFEDLTKNDFPGNNRYYVEFSVLILPCS